MKRNWADAATAYTAAYISTDYDHDLAPNTKSQRAWGNIVYPWQTDRYGFRTGACAPGEADKNKPAIFVIGDSFTEALGSTYEKSFAGLMACDAAKQGKAVWNLGVASYSPVIYYRKIRWPPSDWASGPPRSTSFSTCPTSTTTPMSTRSERTEPSAPIRLPLVPHRPVPSRQLRHLPAGLRPLLVARRSAPLGSWDASAPAGPSIPL